MNPQTHKLLQMTPEEYENLHFSAYMDYCDSRTRTQAQLQKLLGNNALFNWWAIEAQVFIKQYHEIMQHFKGKITRDAAITSYMDHVDGVQKYYPKELLKGALKKQNTNLN